MSFKAKRELLFRVWSRYLDADKNEKTLILNGFLAATGYQRKYAISLLNKAPAMKSASTPRIRRPKYGEETRLALLTIWNTTNQLCGKRLAPFLPSIIASLERFGHLTLREDTRQQLLSISPATIDRVVAKERTKTRKGHSLTKRGTLLKQSIKVRTFADWKEVETGFFEADLVAHCGDRIEGSFLNTLVLTDIATAWTEFAPLLTRSSIDVGVALDAVRQVMPMPLLGLDTDNGAEFINHDLFQYCDREKITFTRSRPYRKNDQAHVEQKNGSIVRRIVGYDRYEGQLAWSSLLNLYRSLRLYVNFFQPSMKLLTKHRDHFKVVKRYDRAQTPYERIIKSKKVPTPTKDKLRIIFEQLDPVTLMDEIGKYQEELDQLNSEMEESNQIVALPSPVEASEPQSRSELITTALRWPRKKHRRSRQLEPRTWRTRKDPFEAVEKEIILALQIAPEINATQLLQQLQLRHPEMFKGNEVRTLRRRLAGLRQDLSPSKELDLTHATAFGDSNGKKLTEATTMS